MSNESRLLVVLAAARSRVGRLERGDRQVFPSTQMRCLWVQWRAACNLIQSWCTSAQKEERHFVDKRKVYDVVPRANAARRGAESLAPDGSRRPGAPMISLGASVARKVDGTGVSRSRRDMHECSSETPDLALVKAVSAHAAQGDTVAVVFDVRRAYLYTFVEFRGETPQGTSKPDQQRPYDGKPVCGRAAQRSWEK